MINLREQYAAANLAIGIPPNMALNPWQPMTEASTMKGANNQKLRKASVKIGGRDSQQLTAIFICDSFGGALRDYLALHFKKIIRVQGARFEDVTGLIEKEHPDVVIDLVVERRMPVALVERREVATERLARQIAESTPILDLTAANLTDHLLESDDLRIDTEQHQGIALEATGGDPQLHLAATNRFSDYGVRVKCVIDSPADTGFAFFYKTAKNKDFTGNNVYIAPLEAGKNTLLFQIDTPIRLDSMRLDPGVAQGRYLLRQFTLVESPRPQKMQ